MQAEATLKYAHDLDMSDEIVAMIRSGKLDIDSLRGLGKNIRAAQAEVLNGIDTGRYNNIDDALKTSGTRHEVSKPRTAHRWTTKCPLAAVPPPEKRCQPAKRI